MQYVPAFYFYYEKWIERQIKDILYDQKMGWPYARGRSSSLFLPHTTFPYLWLQFDQYHTYEM